MVYTQVVTLATYLFFIFTIIGRQKIEGYGPDQQRMASGRIPIEMDLYVPIFTVLQFLFYMGLLKVAEQLINPFGDDDEDFELNWLIDRHVKVGNSNIDFFVSSYFYFSLFQIILILSLCPDSCKYAFFFIFLDNNLCLFLVTRY